MKINSQPASPVKLNHKVYEIYKLREHIFLQVHEKAPSGIWEVYATGDKWVVYKLIGPNTSAVDDWI
jgi:hypothetical protein